MKNCWNKERGDFDLIYRQWYQCVGVMAEYNKDFIPIFCNLWKCTYGPKLNVIRDCSSKFRPASVRTQ